MKQRPSCGPAPPPHTHHRLKNKRKDEAGLPIGEIQSPGCDSCCQMIDWEGGSAGTT